MDDEGTRETPFTDFVVKLASSPELAARIICRDRESVELMEKAGLTPGQIEIVYSLDRGKIEYEIEKEVGIDTCAMYTCLQLNPTIKIHFGRHKE